MTFMSTTTVPTTCAKCNGKGRIEGFRHIADGVCFPCEGTGVLYLEPADLDAQARFNEARTAEIEQLHAANEACKAANLTAWIARHEVIGAVMLANLDLPEIASLVDYIARMGDTPRSPDGPDRLDFVPGWLFSADRIEAAIEARDALA